MSQCKLRFAQKKFLNETCVALLDEDGSLLTFYSIRPEDINLGDVYTCRIAQKMPFLNGYFAKIDYDRDIFIDSKESLKEGQILPVQITKEARMDKVPQAKRIDMPCIDTPKLLKKASAPSPDDDSVQTEEYPWNDAFDEAMEQACESSVLTTDGLRLIFEPTHAFYNIDVDSANSSIDIHKANESAAKRIGQEIVKRNISGNIIIDFMGRKTSAQAKAWTEILALQLDKSPVPYQIMGLSNIGGFGIRRDRTRMELSLANRSQSAQCYALFKEILKTSNRISMIRVPLEMYAALTGLFKNTFDQVQKKYGDSIKIKSDPACHHYEVEYRT